LPAIVHWNFDHFVVVTKVSVKKITVHDPAKGKVDYSYREFSNHFTGVVLEMTPAANFEEVDARSPVRLSSLWTKLTGLGQSVAIVLALTLCLQIVAFSLPFQLQLVVDEAIGNSDRNFLLVIALAFGCLTLLNALIQAMRDWTLQLLGNQLVFQLVGNLVRHLLRLPADFFEKRHIGDILSRITSIKIVQDTLTQGMLAALIDGAMAVIAGIILFVYSPVLASIVLASVLMVLIVTAISYPLIYAKTQEQIVSSAVEQSHLIETIRSATTIKLMGREVERESAWRNLFGRTYNAAVSVGRLEINFTFLRNAILGIQTILVLYLGARGTISGDGFSIGMLVSFLAFRQMFSDRASSLLTSCLEFKMLGLHLGRLSDITVQKREFDSGNPAKVNPEGAIQFENVGFRYSPGDPWIFQGLSINVRPGEFIAITGPSGGGKSTLVKLLLGLQTPTEGSIRIDGQSATAEIWRAWREHVGVVSQDDRLLSGTLADNISFFDPDLKMDAIIAAAQAAQIHAEIEHMPMAYRTLVGDMGSRLSGGQKQRVLLARALYRNPKVLVLDEGTANLDVETEEVIARLLSEMPITRVIVAHRPALIDRAEEVYLLDDGKLALTNESRKSPRVQMVGVSD
jgi:ATP-binding cassette subfamily B protein RaxB